MLDSPHDAQDSKVMISLQVNNSNISLKRDVSKSNIDTAIDFVKNNTLLKTIPKNNLE